jgi:dihydrodipicolinate synthase/N-acetylneuraminate lyase
MGAIVSDGDRSYLHSLYPYAGLDRPFTQQQEQLLLHFMRGMSITAAARASGYTNTSVASALLREPRFQHMLDLLREREFEETRITRDMLNGMLLTAHSKAATATEEILAIKEMGKLNGLYESDKQRGPLVALTVNGRDAPQQKQLGRMSDQELLEMAGEAIT